MKEYSAKLRNKRWLSKKSFELTLEKPSDFTFQSGQRITVEKNNLERDYTPVSSPDEDHLKLLIKVVEGGNLSVVLSKANPGEILKFKGPHGYFIFRYSNRRPLFVATGTGIAPFVSMSNTGVTGFMMLHGVERSEQLYYKNSVRRAASEYIPCISRGGADNNTDLYPGRVTGYIENEVTGKNYDFYLCGGVDMIRDVTVLVDELFPDSKIYSEQFY